MVPRHLPLILCLFFATFTAVSPAYPNRATPAPVEEGIVKEIQQRLVPEKTAGLIVNYLKTANYEKAEGMLTDLLESKPLDRDGYRLLEKVYLLLSFSRDIQVLDTWCARRPLSHFPYTVRGMHYHERARFLDGSNQTLLLSAKQRRNFAVYLRKAQADLEKAYELNPLDPGPPAALTALAVQLKQPRATMEKWFSRSVQADPGWLGGYRAKLSYLAPWRYGSAPLMQQFAVHCFDTAQPGSNTFFVTLDWIKRTSDRAGTSLNSIRFLTKPHVFSLLTRGVARAIDEFPLSPQIETYDAIVETVHTQPYVSIAAFSDGLQENPGDPALLRGRIQSYLASRQFEFAERDLRDLEQLEGVSPFSLVGRASILFHHLRDIDGGTSLYDRAIAEESSPYRRKQYLIDRAEVYRGLGRFTDAEEDYTDAIKEDILFEQAYLGRAKSRYALGDIQAAIADLLILKSTIRGRLATTARSLINTYMKSERDKLIRRDWDAVPPLLQPVPARPAPETEPEEIRAPDVRDTISREHVIHGLRSFYQQDYPTARRSFYRAVAANPNEPKAYFMLGRLAEQIDFDYVKARVFYEQAYRLDPTPLDYVLGVSRTRYRDRDFAAALESLAGYLATLENQETAPADAPDHAQIYFLRGLCFEELGLIPEAVTSMENALRLDNRLKAAAIFIADHGEQTRPPEPSPRSSTPEKQTGDAGDNREQLLEASRQALMDGNADQARVLLLKAIRTNPKAAEPYHLMGRLFSELEQDYPKASLYFSQAIERDNTNPRYFFDRASIHYYYRQYGPAVSDFSEVLRLQPNNEQAVYYRGVCNHMLGNTDAARKDFNTLRQGGTRWDIEIERFRNTWNSEIDAFLNSADR